MTSEARFLNLLVLCIVNLMWAAQYPAYKVASEQMDVAALNFWTFLVATTLLAPFLWRESRKTKGKKTPPRSLVEFAMLGTLGLLPPSVLLAWGIAHSTASNAAILSLTIPVLMVVMAWLLLGEKMTSLRILSLFLALVGTVLISRGDLASGSFSLTLLAGNVVIFLAGAGSAFYNVYSKRLLERFSELQVLVYGYVVAIVCCGITSMVFDSHPFYQVTEYPRTVWAAILVLGGLSWGLAMILWMWVLKRLAVGQVSASVYLLPVFGVMLTAITLHERLSIVHLIGGSLVFIGTFLTSEYEARRNAVQVRGET